MISLSIAFVFLSIRRMRMNVSIKKNGKNGKSRHWTSPARKSRMAGLTVYIHKAHHHLGTGT
jgi:hypothetical protein